MIRRGLRVGIIGCGLIGHKRAAALSRADELVGVTDLSPEAAEALATDFGSAACADARALLELQPEVVIVAVTHDQLAPMAELALRSGAHVLVEKPAAIGVASVERLQGVASDVQRLVKVGFNHRFHPAISRLAKEVHGGEHGALMHVRGRYGHGGRPGYENEWRMQPQHSGGGELIDQGMHLLDLVHWLAGPLPLHSALLRTQFWDVAVEDNAALLLGEREDQSAPWAMLHATWTEWKNMFSLEVYCRGAKLVVDGLVRSYGTQTLRIYRMGPELGPPSLEEVEFPSSEDESWTQEWEHLAAALTGETPLLGDLNDAHYAWSIVEAAYASGPYAALVTA
ncbi:MAG TPA: Gfo/Idh/MocA family oxidoreductase [Solirubrobacteraceae bacterium]|jgi:predicted dehydrogenase